MLFYYVRHGDPIYNPDSLTPLGKRQAEALAKRLALHGVDKIFSSTSQRAIDTAQPTCELLKKDMTLLEFANEYHAWNEITIMANNQREWIFQHPVSVPLLTDPEIINLGFNWYEYPLFKEQNLKAGFERIANEADKFFAELGFEHISNTGRYKVTKKNDERVAMFAHQGFGTAFLSALLDIPYPTFASRFGMTHTGVTVINFSSNGEFCVPTVLSLSNDSHIYKEGLPTKYNNGIQF